MRQFSDSVANPATGRPLIGAQLRVLEHPSGDLATIYADESGTPLANPFPVAGAEAAAPGYAEFWADDGFYDVEYLYSSQPIMTRKKVDLSVDVSHAEVAEATFAAEIGTADGNVQSDLTARPDRDNLGIALFAGTPASPNIAPDIEAARQAAISGRKEVLIPGGTYTATETIELSGANLRILGSGRLFIQSSASPIISIDAGAATKEYGNVLENITLIGDGSPGQVGLYVRNSLQAVRRNIWVRNVAGKAFDIEGDVLSLWENCRGTPIGTPDTVKPEIGWHVRGSVELGATADCTFLNCMAEAATQHGWLFDDAHDCTLIGGTSEGLDGVGIELTEDTSGNTFIGMFCEMNAGGDVVDAGKGNRHINCTMASTANPSLAVKAAAIGCVVEGGDSFHAIVIESGAKNTTLRNFECNTLTDAGTGTVRQDFKVLTDSATRYPGQTLGNVNSFDPLVLDWYEQGSVTASLGGSTGDGSITQTGATNYTRIGDRVFFSTRVDVSAAVSWPTGQLRVNTGLPWVAAGDYVPSLGRMRGITIPSGCDQFVLNGVDGTAYVRIWGIRKDGGAPDIATDANIAGSTPTFVEFTGSFQVAGT